MTGFRATFCTPGGVWVETTTASSAREGWLWLAARPDVAEHPGWDAVLKRLADDDQPGVAGPFTVTPIDDNGEPR